MATVVIELTEDKLDNSVKCFDFVQINSQWTLKERVPKPQVNNNLVLMSREPEPVQESTITVLAPLLDKYTAVYGKDFR